MNADSIKIECEEDGFYLLIDTDPDIDLGTGMLRLHITDPEALYDHVKATIGPWLYERDQALRDLRFANGRAVLEEEDPGPYDPSSTKHPRYHSTHADIWDAREGK